MLRSLKIKLILALFTTSALALAVVAVITPRLIEQRFIHEAKSVHYHQFQRAIEDFLRTNPEWGTASQARQFARHMRQFMDRQRGQLNRQEQQRQARPERLARRPPPGFGPSGDRLYESEFQGSGFDPRPDPQQQPDRQRSEMPFEFLVVDKAGFVLVPTDTRDAGEQVDINDFPQKDEIQVDGSTLAFAITDEDPPLSEKDAAYLEVLKQSLYTGLVIALLMTLIVGYLWGSRLSTALKQLTTAVQGMADGKLQQQVKIVSTDEVGTLAQAFNRMNKQLVDAYQQLEQSHQTIEQQARDLKELSIRDELTGLHNRRYFNEQFTRLHALAVRYQRPFAVILGDIDKFKSINDNFSHLLGDDVLKKVAEIIQQEIREGDIVARYGGEEIAIILPETEAGDAFSITERIRQRIQQYPWQSLHPDLQVTISFGQCTELDLADCMAMLDTADRYLYQAKASGRNRTVNETNAALTTSER